MPQKPLAFMFDYFPCLEKQTVTLNPLAMGGAEKMLAQVFPLDNVRISHLTNQETCL